MRNALPELPLDAEPSPELTADAFDGDAVIEQLRGRPDLRGVLWTAEPLRRSLRYLAESSGINHVLARRDFESAPRAWEVVMLARRLATAAAPPLGAYLDWGFSAIDLDVRATADRDAAAGHIQEFIAALGALFALFGLAALVLPDNLQILMLGAGFGGLHIVFGYLIGRKGHGRKA